MKTLGYAAMGLTAFGREGLGGSQIAPRGKPNFVFILVDDMGAVDASCYGSSVYETPNIDALAAQGMKFTDAYAAAPVCAPTRAGLMTGKYPARVRLTNFIPDFPPPESSNLLTPVFEKRVSREENVIAKALKECGYVSASIGKWDLGPKGSYPEDHGFDLNVGGNAGGMAKSHFYPAWDGNPDIKGRDGEYLTDHLTDEAIKFIRANKDRPFFVYLSHYAVHIPLEAKKQMIEKYRAKIKPTDKHNNPIYAAMIESIDQSVGQVTKALDELGLAENTVVFFTSDNGGLHISEMGFDPATSNEPYREGKGHLYEGGIREPLIVRWPGVVQPGSVCRVPVSSIDFQPTMLEMAGCALKAGQAVDGESLVPVLKQAGQLKRDAIYWHYPHYSPQGGKPSSVVRCGDYKLIRFYEDSHTELYNLAEDVGEQNDLADKMPDKATALDRMLGDWLEQVNAQMPRPDPNHASQE